MRVMDCKANNIETIKSLHQKVTSSVYEVTKHLDILKDVELELRNIIMRDCDHKWERERSPDLYSSPEYFCSECKMTKY